MPQRWMLAGVAVLGLASLAGCGDAKTDERLARIETRMSALEGKAGRTPEGQAATGAAPHGVTADVISLEKRLAAIEQRMAAVEKVVSTPPTPGVASGRMEQRRERRARLREVTDEYRARLAEIRQNQTDPAARQEAVREALEWYREQRRAVLSGEPPEPNAP